MLQTTETHQPSYLDLEPAICDLQIAVELLFHFLVDPPYDDDAETINAAVWLTRQICGSADKLKEGWAAVHAARGVNRVEAIRSLREQESRRPS